MSAEPDRRQGPNVPTPMGPMDWCARWGFVRDLWFGRPRVVLDDAVAAALQTTKQLPAPAAVLLAELVPERASSVWLLTEQPSPESSSRRRNVHRVDDFEAVLAQTTWDVALVDLAEFFVAPERLSRFAARARSRLENRLETRAFRLLSALAEATLDGRTVLVSIPASARGGLGLGDFQELLEQHFLRARVYALASAAVSVAVDCGDVVRQTDDDPVDVGGHHNEDDEDDDDSPPPLAFDNRLGDDLRYDTYLALVNAVAEPEGVTLVELPRSADLRAAGVAVAAPEAVSEVATGDAIVEDLRVQLGQARRQVELAAIARQSLVEQLDAAQARVDSLEDQLAELLERQSLASEDVEAEAEADEDASDVVVASNRNQKTGDPRPDATQALVLSLRWQLEQTRAELRQALGRPVEALEREVAELRARFANPSPDA